MTQIHPEIRKALIEVSRPSDVDQALEKIGLHGPVRELRNELDFDSLDQIEFIMALEENLDIEISDEEAEEIINSDITVAQFQEKLLAKCTA